MYRMINIVPVKKHNSISMESLYNLESLYNRFPQSTSRNVTIYGGKAETKSHETKLLRIISKIKHQEKKAPFCSIFYLF